MNCTLFDQQLDDWLDDELSGAEARALQAHIEQCSECARRLALARTLQQRVFALPSERQPERDLWLAISRRLEPRNKTFAPHPWWRGLAAAVAVVVVFAAGIVADRAWREDPQGVNQQADARQLQRRSLPSVAEARRILPAAHVELIEGAGDGAHLATEQNLLQNLLVVNLAIRRVEAAIEDEPGNANLHDLLGDLYARENRILVEAERLRVEQQSPTRTGI